jgi:hypothetical protein
MMQMKEKCLHQSGTEPQFPGCRVCSHMHIITELGDHRSNLTSSYIRKDLSGLHFCQIDILVTQIQNPLNSH